MAIEVVVDSSVIAAVVTPEEHSDWAAEKLSEGYFHIIDLSYYEVANAMKYKTKGKRFSDEDAVKAFTEAVTLMNLYAIHGFSEIVADAFAIALTLGITVYDASFLSLSDKLGIKLLTLDEKLAKTVEGTKYHHLIERP